MLNAYDYIEKYKISLECSEPLHIGSGEGKEGSILIHPTDRLPFLQGSSITGVLRNYIEYTKGKEFANEMFGEMSNKGKDYIGSRISVSDGKFDEESVQIELRPRLKLNNKSGTVDYADPIGGGRKSGQKMDMEYVGKGAKVSFYIYFYGKKEITDSYNQIIMKAIKAIHTGIIQIGGQKSNGCGNFEIKSVEYDYFNMMDESGRKNWYEENDNQLENITDEIISLSLEDSQVFDIEVKFKSNSGILVQGYSIIDDHEIRRFLDIIENENLPDAINMINGRNEYIIPATSIKGAFRNRMEMISGYLQLPTTVIEDTFGSESRDKKAKLGNIQFFDCILGNIDNEGNSRAKKNTRIKIDKFTGGVMNQALFTEAPVDTQTEFRIRLKGDNINSSLGLLFYALRDISIGAFSLGGGSNIGHGFIEVLTIQCKKNNDIIIEIDGGKVKKGLDVLESYLKIG